MSTDRSSCVLIGVQNEQYNRVNEFLPAGKTGGVFAPVPEIGRQAVASTFAMAVATGPTLLSFRPATHMRPERKT
ncbi:hypothetical protein GCM10027419_15040 [Pandoraea terrae]